MMLKSHRPFQKATICDSYYKMYLVAKREYWKFHFEDYKTQKFTKQAIKLMNKMFKYNPEDRCTLSEVKKSKWYNGPMPSRQDVIEEMTFRINSKATINETETD